MLLNWNNVKQATGTKSNNFDWAQKLNQRYASKYVLKTLKKLFHNKVNVELTLLSQHIEFVKYFITYQNFAPFVNKNCFAIKFVQKFHAAFFED